jgi:hypothetical protein
MRLSAYIRQHSDLIIAEWQNFAKSLSPAAYLTNLQLRDHIQPILVFIARDIESTQTPQEQIEKSHGELDGEAAQETVAEIHGALRHDEGFDIVQMVSEYRALRSSIIKLWTTSKRVLEDIDVLDLIRFNESIDQALAESVVRFMEEVNYSKDLLLAVLGHDIRSPLGAIIMSAQLLPRMGELNEKQSQVTAQIADCGNRLSSIVQDLLDLAGARIGSGLPVVKAPMDIGVLARQMVDEVQIQQPHKKIVLALSGDLRGEWDATRLGQFFSNLLSNAAQYGPENMPIHVTLKGSDDDVMLSIQNGGEPIPQEQMATLFHSFTRGEKESKSPDAATTNLGLGLFITKEIVTAHGGTIDVVSNVREGTTFNATLPKK